MSRYQALLQSMDVPDIVQRLKAVHAAVRYEGYPSVLEEEIAVARRYGEDHRRQRARDGGPADGPDLLLLTVGTSLDPLVLAVAFHAPRRIVLLVASDKSDEDVQLCAEELRLFWRKHQDTLPAGTEIETVDVRASARSVFAVVRKLVENARRNGHERVLVDITGAKKSMVVGAFLAAGFLGVETGYVDFEEYDPILRRPMPETTRPRIVENPYAFFRLRDEENLERLFDERRFDRAADLAHRLAELSCDPAVTAFLGSEADAARERYLRIGNVAAAYERWGRGAYRECVQLLGVAGEPVPPTVAALGSAWPGEGDSHQQIVRALAPTAVFSNTETPAAYFMDVLAWFDDGAVARDPRTAFVRIFGAVETLLSFLLYRCAVCHPERVELLISDETTRALAAQPSLPSMDVWLPSCRAAVAATVTERSTGIEALNVLAGKRRRLPGTAWGKDPSIGDGARKAILATLESSEFRLEPPVLENTLWAELAQSADGVHFFRFNDLRNKTVHFVAPVPVDEARQLRSFFLKALRQLLPVAQKTMPSEERQHLFADLIGASRDENHPIWASVRPKLFAALFPGPGVA